LKKKNAGRGSFRKTKKREGKMAKSRRRLGVSKKQVADYRRAHARKNPAVKMKRVPKGGGWQKATAVRFVRRNGRTVVLVRKPGAKRK